MQSYLGGQEVTLTIPLVDATGEAVEVSAVQYRLLDQNEVEVIELAALDSFSSGDADAVVTIPAEANELLAQAREMRVVELRLTTPSGIIVQTYEYVLESATPLSIGVNSFQTLSFAVMTAFELPGLVSWPTATRQERINALMSAYRNMGKLKLRYVNADMSGVDQKRLIVSPDYSYYDVTQLTADQLATLPADFQLALRRAQVYEADFLMGGDATELIRRSGVMSATVGESSQFFRTSKPHEGAVCRRALRELSRYIVSTHKIGRA